jgi:hypothetical protein
VRRLVVAAVALSSSCAAVTGFLSGARRGDLAAGVAQAERDQQARDRREEECKRLNDKPVTWEEEREIGGAVAVVLGTKTKGPYTELSPDVVNKPLAELANKDVTPPKGERAALNEYVNKVGKALAAVSERPDIRWTFMVLDEPTVNAFSAPGGYVFVTTGLLKAVDNEAQLAGVLGHEIGHVTGRHALDGYRRQKVSLCKAALTGEDLEKAARVVGGPAGLSQLQREASRFSGDFSRLLNVPVFDVSNATRELVRFLTEQFVELLSAVGNGADTDSARRNEFSADEAAGRYMSFAGYDPLEYERFIGRLADGGGLFQPHPSNKDRMAALAKARGGDVFFEAKAAPALTAELQGLKRR